MSPSFVLVLSWLSCACWLLELIAMVWMGEKLAFVLLLALPPVALLVYGLHYALYGDKKR